MFFWGTRCSVFLQWVLIKALFSANKSVQSTCRTRSSSVVTLARPSVCSSLQITNHSFRYASRHLWNQLPSSFLQPHSVHCPPGSPHPAYITSSQSPPSLASPITASTFHSRLKTLYSIMSFHYRRRRHRCCRYML